MINALPWAVAALGALITLIAIHPAEWRHLLAESLTWLLILTAATAPLLITRSLQ